MKHLLITTLLWLLAGQVLAQTPLPSTTPEKVGMSANRLAQIDKHLQNYVDKQ